MIAVKFPTMLKVDAVELEDGNWRLQYEEYFKPEHLEAFKNSFILLKEASKEKVNLTVDLDEDSCCVHVIIEGPRGVVFGFLCGEFFGLSNIAQLTLLDLFVGASVGALYISRGKVKCL